MKVCSWIICFRTDCSDILRNTGLHAHWYVSFHRWHRSLMLNGKDTLLHILAWKHKCVLLRNWEHFNKWVSQQRWEAHFHLALCSNTCCALLVNKPVFRRHRASGRVNRQRQRFRLWLQGVLFNVQQKALRARLKDAIKKWPYIIYFPLQYIVL